MNPSNPNLWTRRKFSKAALAAQALLSMGLLSVTGCSPASKDHQLSDTALKDILAKALDTIIPATENMPAASDLKSVEYIYEVLAEYEDLKTLFQQILSDLNVAARKQASKGFPELDTTICTEVLKAFEAAQPQSFGVLKNFAYESYYTNPKIWGLIGYEPYPTLSAGPKMDPFDPALLKRVKDLPPLYLDTDASGNS